MIMELMYGPKLLLLDAGVIMQLARPAPLEKVQGCPGALQFYKDTRASIVIRCL